MNGGELFTHLVQRVRFKEQEVTLYSGEIVLALEHLHKVKLLQKLHTYFHSSFPLQSDWTVPHFERIVKVIPSFTQKVLLLSPAYSIPHSVNQARANVSAALKVSWRLFTKRGRKMFLMHACSVRSSHYSERRELPWRHCSICRKDLDSEINIVLVQSNFFVIAYYVAIYYLLKYWCIFQVNGCILWPQTS